MPGKPTFSPAKPRHEPLLTSTGFVAIRSALVWGRSVKTDAERRCCSLLARSEVRPRDVIHQLSAFLVSALARSWIGQHRADHSDQQNC